MRAVVIGDCLLDIAIAHGPIAPGGDRPAQIRLSPGGQGSNVAVRLARRKVETRLIAASSDDLAGRLLGERLAAEGVTLIPVRAARSGAVAVLLDADGERTMLSDRVAIDARALVAALGAAGGADWFHVSGYALRDPAGEILAEWLRVRQDGTRLSIDGGSVTPADGPSFGERLSRCRPDLLIVNRGEAAVLTDAGERERLVELAARLAAGSSVAVVTGGSAGSAAAGDAGRIELAAPVLKGPMVDATGAGDAFTAAMIAELAGAGWPPSHERLLRAMQAGNAAGAEAAGLHGAQATVSGE